MGVPEDLDELVQVVGPVVRQAFKAVQGLDEVESQQRRQPLPVWRDLPHPAHVPENGT